MNADSLAPLLDEDAAAENAERRTALDLLVRIYELREARRQLDANLKEIEQPLRDWFMTHPDEQELYDDERGFKARMQPRSAGIAYDAAAAIKNRDPQLYARLEELGALEVDPKRVQDAISRSQLMKGDIERYSHKRDGSPALLVEKVEK